MQEHRALTFWSKSSFYIFIYIVAGAGHAILIKYTARNSRELPYNPVSVTLAIEFCKLLGALFAYFTWADNQSYTEKWNALTTKAASIGVLYSIPAGLYCVYNALMFFAVAMVGPGPYRVLINVKVLMAGVMLNLAGAKKLSGRQWFGLCLLVVACSVEQVGSFNWDIGFDAIVMVLIMGVCSASAGVTNQLLLQKRQTAVLEHGGRHVWQNNIFMYSWSSAFNVLYLMFTAPEALSVESFMNFDWPVFAIIVGSCFLGFATAFLLAEASVIVKEYANFFDMLLTVFLSWIVFDAEPKSTLLLAIFLVSISLYLYNVEPAPEQDTTTGGSGTSGAVSVPLTSIAVGAGSASADADAVPLLAQTPDPARP